jgi:uncharacterized membrane protein YhaH (DUF805 family)
MQEFCNSKHSTSQGQNALSKTNRSNWWYLLLLLPLIGLLYPPFYARMYPMLWGIPFFIWYQFAWVFGGVATTLTVAKLTS